MIPTLASTYLIIPTNNLPLSILDRHKNKLLYTHLTVLKRMEYPEDVIEVEMAIYSLHVRRITCIPATDSINPTS